MICSALAVRSRCGFSIIEHDADVAAAAGKTNRYAQLLHIGIGGDDAAGGVDALDQLGIGHVLGALDIGEQAADVLLRKKPLGTNT